MVYPAGTVAMANAGPDTNGSQFFLVYADSTLPPDYTVFGTITEGLDVHHRASPRKGITGSRQRHRTGRAGDHLHGHHRRLTGPGSLRREPPKTAAVRYDDRTTESTHSSRGAEGHGPMKPRQPLSMITFLVTA